VLLITLLSIASVLLLGGGILAALFLFRGRGGPETASAMKFLPDNPPMIFSWRVADFWNSRALQDLKRELPQFEAALLRPLRELAGRGLPGPQDVSSILAGGTKGKMTAVMAMTRDITTQDLLRIYAGPQFNSEIVDPYTMYNCPKISFCLVNSRLVVLGQEADLRLVLRRNGEPQLSANLRAALAEVDLGKTFTAAIDAAAMPGQNVQPGRFEVQLGPDPEAVAIDCQIGNDVSLRAILVYKDAATAQEARQQIDPARAKVKAAALELFVGKEVTDILDRTEVRQEGARIVATTSFEVAPVARALARFVPRGGIGPGPLPQPNPR
jgi:hypothetical protein